MVTPESVGAIVSMVNEVTESALLATPLEVTLTVQLL
jgi:hypothetical protein